MTVALSPGAVVILDGLQGERFVVETVRRGGMGLVAKLVALRPGRPPAAFKTYLQIADAERFEKEARAWSALTGHPNIARLDWFGEWQGVSATFGAWYPRSLAEVSFAADPERGFELVLGIVEALVYAADEHAILHRDLKPANVLIDEGGSALVGDFGLAAAAAPHSGPVTLDALRASMRSLATVGGIAGTPVYMAPELFAGEPPSVASELYALGVTLYEFVTGGEHPYVGSDTDFRFQPRLRRKPLQRLAGAIGPLDQLLPSLLALDPGDRPASFGEVLSGLGRQRHRRRRSSFDIAIEASTLRRQGRLQAAQALLESGLDERGGDPVLLNGLSLVLTEQGDREAASQALERATKRLILTEGRYEGDIYLDPLVNLAREMIRKPQFDEAEQLLGKAEVWLASSPDEYRLWYPEFAWLYLYRGDFHDCCEHFSGIFRSRESTDFGILYWFVLAAWLGGEQQRWANEIARQLRGRVTSWPLGLLALVVSDALGAAAGAALMRDVPLEIRNDLRARLAKAKVSTTISFPLDAEVVSLVLHSLDHEATGGKFTTEQ